MDLYCVSCDVYLYFLLSSDLLKSPPVGTSEA